MYVFTLTEDVQFGSFYDEMLFAFICYTDCKLCCTVHHSKYLKPFPNLNCFEIIYSMLLFFERETLHEKVKV